MQLSRIFSGMWLWPKIFNFGFVQVSQIYLVKIRHFIKRNWENHEFHFIDNVHLQERLRDISRVSPQKNRQSTKKCGKNSKFSSPDSDHHYNVQRLCFNLSLFVLFRQEQERKQEQILSEEDLEECRDRYIHTSQYIWWNQIKFFMSS